MAIERTALFVSLAINLVTLSFLVLQTRYLARQTTSLNRSLEYPPTSSWSTTSTR